MFSCLQIRIATHFTLPDPAWVGALGGHVRGAGRRTRMADGASLVSRIAIPTTDFENVCSQTHETKEVKTLSLPLSLSLSLSRIVLRASNPPIIEVVLGK